MRDLSCQLESRYVIIPFNKLFGFLGLIPEKVNIRKAAQDLIFLSNAGGKAGQIEKNYQAIEDLKICLKIEL